MTSVMSDDSGDEDKCWYNEDAGPFNRLSKDLEDFRSVWQTELREKRMGIFRPNSNSKKSKADSPTENLEKAKKLFLLGYSAEKDGKLADAIEYYRHAVLIDPSIEANVREDLREFRSTLARHPSHLRDQIELSENQAPSSPTSSCMVEQECIIYKEHEQSACHISSLPNELLTYIMRWVVGKDLDVRSMEQISMTCRALYFICRDTELWRLICLKTFGRTFEFPTDLDHHCSTWRDFYIKVPHIHFNGCYISRVVYHRRGDISLDCAYQPWHSVEYYRYFRFFSDGTVLTLTTSDDPATSLPRLKSRQSKFINVISGIYRVSGQNVNIILEKASTADISSKYRCPSSAQQTTPTTLTYYICFEMKNRRYRSYFTWKSYRVVSRLPTGKESINDFDVDSISGRESFPPLFFSRVKSFSATSDSPLA